MDNESTYIAKLLEGWEDVHKKSQLTLWILLALKAGEKHMAAIKDWITDATDDTISADDKSMYRALRRLHDAGIVAYRQEPGNGGPDRKVYGLTSIGQRTLQTFLQRNIIGVLYKPTVRDIIEKGC